MVRFVKIKNNCGYVSESALTRNASLGCINRKEWFTHEILTVQTHLGAHIFANEVDLHQFYDYFDHVEEQMHLKLLSKKVAAMLYADVDMFLLGNPKY